MEGIPQKQTFVTRSMNEPDETKKGFHSQLGRFITILSKTERVSDMGDMVSEVAPQCRGSKLSTIMEFYNRKIFKSEKGNSQLFGNLPM